MRVEVLEGVKRRRRWTDERKLSILMEVRLRGATVTDVARRHADTSGHRAGPGRSWFALRGDGGGRRWRGSLGSGSLEERWAAVSAPGDPRETRAARVEVERVRPVRVRARGEGPRGRGGRPGFERVLELRRRVLRSLHGRWLERTEPLVRDRRSWVRLGRAGPWRCGARRRHPAGPPRGADRGRCARGAVGGAAPARSRPRAACRGAARSWTPPSSRRRARATTRARGSRSRRAARPPGPGPRRRPRRVRAPSTAAGASSPPRPRRAPRAGRGSPSRSRSVAAGPPSRSSAGTPSSAARSSPRPSATTARAGARGGSGRPSRPAASGPTARGRSAETEARPSGHGRIGRLH